MAGIGLDFPVCCVQLLEGWADSGEGNRRESCFVQESWPQSLEMKVIQGIPMVTGGGAGGSPGGMFCNQQLFENLKDLIVIL